MYSEKLQEFRGAVNQSLANATSPRRDEMAVLATVLWYWRVRELLRPILGNSPTPYAIERYLEPEGFGRTHQRSLSPAEVGQVRRRFAPTIKNDGQQGGGHGSRECGDT